MSHQKQRHLSYILIALGLMLLFGGVVIWQQQIHAEMIEQQEIWLAESTYAAPTAYAPPTWRIIQISLTPTPNAYIFDYPESMPTVVLEPIASPIKPSTLLRTDTQNPPTTIATAPQPTNTPLATNTATDTPQPTNTPTRPPSPTLAPSPTVPPEPLPPAQNMPSRILAPAIELDSEVVEMGWQVENESSGNPQSEWIVPEFAAGWHKNSALPGHGGNTVLSGHNNIGSKVFRYLADLETGDQIELEADGIRYRYVVEEKYIFKEAGEALEVRIVNNKFIEPTQYERLTLVSCWPYTTNSHRIVIIGRPLFE